MGKELYNDLGLPETANAEQIKKAYRKLAMKYHPDRNPGDPKAEEMFKKINKANEILSDPEKKAMYDQFGEESLNGMGSQFGGGDPFAEIFRQMHGQGRNQTPQMQAAYVASLEEIYAGGKAKVKIPKENRCNSCNATGFSDKQPHYCKQCGGSGISIKVTQTGNTRIQQQMFCPICRGSKMDLTVDPKVRCADCSGKGTITINDEVEFEIPRDISRNRQVIVKGTGLQYNGMDVDLIVVINVKMSKGFNMTSDRKLIYTLHINMTETICGLTKIIDHPSGKKISIKVDPGYIINPDNIYILDNLGFPSYHGNDVMYLSFVIHYPESITLPSKKALSFYSMEKVFGERRTPNDDDSDLDSIDQYNLKHVKKINNNARSNEDLTGDSTGDSDSDNEFDESPPPGCAQQ